jgi:hypothetical protein
MMVAGPSTVQRKRVEGALPSVLALRVVGADLLATNIFTSPTRKKEDVGV